MSNAASRGPLDIGAVPMDPAEDMEQANDRLYQLGLTDGLPVIPPTERRVEQMLAGRNPGQEYAVLAPARDSATARRLAVCAVMAGCQPAHFPLVIAAVQAVAQPQFNLLGIQTTTGTATPLVIVNGPVVKRLGLNAVGNALGPGERGNATIGRALAFALRNIGGAIPGRIDMATMGQPGKYTMCVAENEDASPWEPLHVSRGYSPEESTVTVVGASGTMEMKDDRSSTAEGVLTTFAASMTSAGAVGGAGLLSGGEPLLLIAPEHAHIIGRSLSRKQAQQFLHERARLPLHALGAAVRDHLLEVMDVPAGEMPELRVCERPDQIMLAVVGGVGIKSTYIPTWGGSTIAVTCPVDSL
ncbi:MAG: hypothetical protein O7A69_14000 [SAR324 cluster bacterium]|nr:hypothetical protein [SAR324 cluster bacterium]